MITDTSTYHIQMKDIGGHLHHFKLVLLKIGYLPDVQVALCSKLQTPGEFCSLLNYLAIAVWMGNPSPT